MKEPKVAILLLNWNRASDTIECLESLEKLSYPHFSLFVIDNGSSDDSVMQIRKRFPHLFLVESGENLGFAGGTNLALSLALEKGCDFFLFLNNDTIVSPDFLKALMEASKAKPQAAILGAKILRYHDPDTIDHLGGRWDHKKANFFSLHSGEKEIAGKSEKMEEVDYVCGCALLCKREVVETIGLLEERFFLLWEEADFCFRAKRAGFEIWTAPKARLWHKISSSFSGGKPHTHYFWWRNRLFWIERNLSKKEKASLFFKVLFPEIFKIHKRWLLSASKKIFFRSEKGKKESKLYFAGCLGIWDYCRRRFGNAPSFLLKP